MASYESTFGDRPNSAKSTFSAGVYTFAGKPLAPRNNKGAELERRIGKKLFASAGMRNCRIALALAHWLAVQSVQPLQVFTTMCGLPETIVVTHIPGSYNSLFTTNTTSGGIGLLGMSALGKLVDTKFVGAEIGQVNDFWSLSCVYTSLGSSIALESNDSPVWQTCHFLSGAQQTCATAASVSDCVIKCPSPPPPAAPSQRNFSTASATGWRATKAS
jgi:hypothetical protein